MYMLGMCMHIVTCVCKRVDAYGYPRCTIYNLENAIYTIVCTNVLPYEGVSCVTCGGRRNSKTPLEGAISFFHVEMQALRIFTPLLHPTRKKIKRSLLCNIHLPKLLYAWFALMCFTFIYYLSLFISSTAGLAILPLWKTQL